MQTLKVKPVFCLAATQIFTRSVSANTAPPNSQQQKPYSEIPGPSSLPIIGPARHFLPGGELYNTPPLELGARLIQKYGPIIRLKGFFGRLDYILLFDPESCAQVLRSENWLPMRPGFESLKYYRRTKKQDLSEPTGLITDHGDVWKQFRSTVNPVLLQPKTIQLYRDMLDEVARDMVKSGQRPWLQNQGSPLRIPLGANVCVMELMNTAICTRAMDGYKKMESIRGDNNMLQGKFDEELNLWSLESIGLVALGRRLNCFDPNLPADSPAKRLIQLVHEIFIISNDLDFKPSLWRYYETRGFKKAMRLYEEQANITKHFIDKTVEELESKKNTKSEDEKGILEKLLEINKEVALIIATDMLFAGVDTTSNTITAALYLLANNQEKQDKLREELASGSEKRPYLKACIKESLRMIPVVPGNLRLSSKEYNLLGYAIPKGTQLCLVHQTMSMLESEYPRAKEYIPERWIVGKDDPLYHGNAHPFAYSPFGFGVRSCISRRIAELEMETFLARIIERYRVEWFGPPIQVVSTSLNYITGPFNFVFKDV